MSAGAIPREMTPASRQRTWASACSIIEPQISTGGTHIWPFDMSFPIDLRHLGFDARPPIRMNQHDYCELVLACSGRLAFQVEDRYLNVDNGDLFVMGNGLFHRPVLDHSQKAAAIVLYFMPELIRPHEADIEGTEYLMPFLAQDSTFPHVIPARSVTTTKVTDLLHQIESELPASSPQSRLYVKTCLKMILAILNKHYASCNIARVAFSRKQRDLDRLRPLFEYMNQHYGERISIPKAASLVYMSKSHFVRFFKQATGQAFAGYLKTLRLARAQDLLLMTDKSIAEIGREVGFCDQSHFGMVFRRHLGMTPLQYRSSPFPTVEGSSTVVH